MQNINNWRMGVNLAFPNDASRQWKYDPIAATMEFPENDLSIKDPGVMTRFDWRFPDVSRSEGVAELTPIRNIRSVGWLGQIHRGTPWQTLYLKSKEPGLINNITAVNNGIVTALNHNISTSEEVELTGKCPPEWELNFRAGGRLDAKGNIKPGELKGYAQTLNANQFRIWPTKKLADWVVGADSLPVDAVADTSKLTVQNIQYWQNWAGSEDTMPSNDRRLLEVFSVGEGMPIRGRFSVNNVSHRAWAAALCGISVPLRGTMAVSSFPRILGANNADLYPLPEELDLQLKRCQGRIDMWDAQWWKIVQGINSTRGVLPFARVTDILKVPQLSDKSPYAQNFNASIPIDQRWGAWKYMNISGFKDELDLERIPMQLLSLLRVDEDPIFETYIISQRLRPALRVNLPNYKGGSAIGPDGTILNYEVAGQAVRRVIYKLAGAKEWHKSMKDGATGKWRDRFGNLRRLPPMRPIVLHSSTLQGTLRE